MSDARNPATPNPYSGIRLVEFQIDKLFDEYTYKILLKLGAHVTAIIAPNGTGKTLCLRLIAGLFEEKWSIFADNVFEKITYTFTDNTKVEITKPRSQGAPEQEQNRQAFHLKINHPGDLVGEEWSPQLSADPRRILNVERYIPYVRRAGPNLWRDERTGEIYNLVEVMEEFGEILPESVKASFYGKKPEALTKLTSQIDCHLIETQRLLILREDVEPYYHTAGRRPPSTLAISQKAEALKEIISLQINAYATLSQSLDRSFPRRLITEPNMLSPEELSAQLKALDERRKELMEAGILATEADDPVARPEGPLAPQISQVLSVYADDTRQKLASLSGLLAKINTKSP